MTIRNSIKTDASYKYAEQLDANGCPFNDPFCAFIQMQCLLAGKWVGRTNLVLLIMNHFNTSEEDAFFIVDRRMQPYLVSGNVEIFNVPITDEEELIYERYLRLSDEPK